MDLENFQPLARFKVQKFAEVASSSVPRARGGSTEGSSYMSPPFSEHRELQQSAESCSLATVKIQLEEIHPNQSLPDELRTCNHSNLALGCNLTLEPMLARLLQQCHKPNTSQRQPNKVATSSDAGLFSESL